MGDTVTLADHRRVGPMPWLETVPVKERERFIDDHRLGLYTMIELKLIVSGMVDDFIRQIREFGLIRRAKFRFDPGGLLRGSHVDVCHEGAGGLHSARRHRRRFAWVGRVGTT